MKNAFNSDCYEVNRVKSPLHGNPNLLIVNELSRRDSVRNEVTE